MSGKRRVFVVAWDGATMDLLGPWCEGGLLPTLRGILERGTSGKLRSTYPPLTGPAWASFMTGKSPGNHGVFEFFHRREGSYSQALSGPSSIEGRSLWRLLSDAEKKVGVMNVPLTYPPEAVNGFLITGLLTPHDCSDWAYPRELVDELRDNVGTYLIHHDEKYTKSNVDNLLEEEYRILKSRTEAALYLLKAKEWDFFMVHYYGPDRMTHEFWHVMDPSHPQHDTRECERYGNPVLPFFQRLDADLGRLASELREDDVLMLMSDHGMGRVTKFVNVNSWLLEEGFLTVKRDIRSRLRYALFRSGFNYYVVGKLVLRLGWGKRAVQVGRGRRQQLQERVFFSFREVDWSRTRAYSMGNYGQIFVNLRGREPGGCVSPGHEYEELLDELTERLHSLEDPESGERVVERVFRASDLYSGGYVDRAPDLMFMTRGMEYKAQGLSDFTSPRVLEPVYGCTGNHRMEGILAVQGQGVVNEAGTVVGAAIEDLAPTILYMLGVPVPGDMDGRVLESVFTPEFLSTHPVEYGETMPSAPQGRGYSLEEEEELSQRLKGLGYV
ncbi:MAG TPA: alkaline phosphatase family protein [Anaerolineae bacterium]|nr:alkaline phosphatase family protein [Anaerolineae bacterium]